MINLYPFEDNDLLIAKIVRHSEKVSVLNCWLSTLGILDLHKHAIEYIQTFYEKQTGEKYDLLPSKGNIAKVGETANYFDFYNFTDIEIQQIKDFCEIDRIAKKFDINNYCRYFTTLAQKYVGASYQYEIHTKDNTVFVTIISKELNREYEISGANDFQLWCKTAAYKDFFGYLEHLRENL